MLRFVHTRMSVIRPGAPRMTFANAGPGDGLRRRADTETVKTVNVNLRPLSIE
jgi:hypothetical protein